MQSIKSTFEASELRNQSIQIEDSRAKTSQIYEAEMKPLSNLHSSNEKAHYKQTQTEETDHSNVDSLKLLLSQVSSECQRLEQQLEKQQDIQILVSIYIFFQLNPFTPEFFLRFAEIIFLY